MSAQGLSTPLRFVVVGAMNSLFGYITFAALIALGCQESWAVLGALGVGVVFNFLSYGALVFASLSVARVPRFVATYLFVYTIDLLGLRVLVRVGLDVYVSQGLLVIPLAAMTYALNSQWVFRDT